MSESGSPARGRLLGVRLRYGAARVVQFAGFYLIFASLLVLFEPLLRVRGIGLGWLPDGLLAPVIALNVSPIFALLVGFPVVWWATSPWFIGTDSAR